MGEIPEQIEENRFESSAEIADLVGKLPEELKEVIICILEICVLRKELSNDRVSFSTLFDADFGELNEKNFCLYLMVCCLYLEVKASLKRLKALTSKYRQHEK